LVAADHEASSPISKLFQPEATQTLHVGPWPRLRRIEPAASVGRTAVEATERVGFDDTDAVRIHDVAQRTELQLVTNGDVLPLGVDFLDTTPTTIVEQVPGVPAPRSQPICTSQGHTCLGVASMVTAVVGDRFPARHYLSVRKQPSDLFVGSAPSCGATGPAYFVVEASHNGTSSHSRT
jgi:hypothetical protein